MADTVRELVIKVSVENDTEKGFSDIEKGQERAEVQSVALGTALVNFSHGRNEPKIQRDGHRATPF